MENYTIYRYPVTLSSEMLRGNETATLELPAGALLVNAGYQPWNKGQVQLWYMIDLDETDKKTVEIMVLGTGFGKVSQDTVSTLSPINTVIAEDAQEVYHVFEVVPRQVIPLQLCHDGCPMTVIDEETGKVVA